MARHRRPHRSSPTTVTRNRPPIRKHIRPRPLRFEPLEDRRVLSILGPMGGGSSMAPLGLPAESPSAHWLFPGEYIPVGRGPWSLAAADLNGNGVLDAVTANYDDNTVSVLIGRGDGSFEPQTTFEVGGGPYSVAVADFNGNGIPDLVTANYIDNTVSVLAGRGDGTFEPQTTFEVGGGTSSVAVADLNDDGIPDLVTANYNDNTVSVLTGRGDGTFEPQTTLDVGVSPWSVAIADLNGNGIPDLVTANYNDNTVSVLVGHGDATFAAHRTFDVGHQPTFVAIADLNGNGIPDLVTADYREYTISVLMGRGDGTFEEQTTFDVANRTEAVAVVDVNRDGIPDLVTAEGSDGYISVLIGEGDGTFAEHATFQPGIFPMSLAIADFNGDGIADLLTGNYADDTNTVAVLLGFGDGTFEAQTTLGVGQTAWSWPYAVAAADLNGDGVPDLIAANSWEACVSVLTGRGDGTFEEQTTFEVGYNPYDVVVTDLNGDGVPDVVTADRNNWTVSVLLGLGGGAFEEFTTYEVGPRPMSVAVADLNGDGVPDLVTANENDHTVSVLLGLGDGTFAAQTTFGVGRWPSSVAIADLDGDGIPDVVTSNRLDATVSVLLGLGNGAFGEHVTFEVGLRPQSVAVADLNGDGVPDLVTANEDGGTVSVLLGLGDGTFGAQTTFEVGGSPMAVIVSDVDRNGVPDLITANNDYYGTVSVLAGRGDGTFEAPRRFAVGIFPQSVAVADLNGDGALDLVAANGNDDTLSVLLGRAIGVKHFPFEPVAPPVVALEIRFPQPMDTGSFSLADDIDSFTGPAGTITPSEFSWLSNRILQIKFPDQTTAGHYEMMVGPMILDAEGNSMDEPYVATFTIHAPQVTGHSPSGKVLPPVDSLQLSFTHPMDKTSFSLDEDIVSFTGPEGDVTPTGFAWQDDTTLQITFAPQRYFGSYQFVLAPSVYDIYGNLLDQDRDGVGGELVEDRYTAAFATRYMGTMTQDTTWGPDHGAILVDGMVTVAEGVTLTIEPGTVVQFGDGASLHVAGLLDVQGSVENPVILTSIHDHSAGGGPSGADPAPGDWMGLHVRGTGRAKLEHFEIRYATNAIDANDAGAKVDLTSGILRDSSQYGIYVWSAYVDVTAENVVIANNGWTGVFMRASSRGTFTNCTIVGNGFGGSGYGRSEGIHHGAVTLTLDNVTVAFNANGILHGGDPPEVTIRHSLFWNPDGQEYINPPPENRDFLERDGNLRANPLFVDREAGNYELGAFSPAIDAGRGLGAPATDILGRPRFDDLGMPNVATGYPAYVDIGAYERQENTVTGDLAVLHVATPHPIFLSAGENFTVQWTVANVGAADCAGPWTDTVYLSRRQHFGADAVPLGTFTYQGDLAPSERYTGTLTGNAPSEAGVYYVIVRANAEGTLAEPVVWNNVMTGTHVLAVDLPVLEVGQSVSGAVTHGQWDYVRLEAEPGNTMVLTLEAGVQSGATGLYVRYGAPPTLENYDARAAVPNRTDQELRILSPREGVYFVGVYGTRLPYGSTNYVLSAEPTELAIHRVSPGGVGNAGPVTLEIVGDNFSRGVQVKLVGPDGVPVIEGDPWFQDASTLYATFDLAAAGAAPGVYDLSVTQPGVASVTEFGAVTVMMGGAAELSTSLTVPGMARPGRNIPVTVSYVNAGRVDLPSPLMTLQNNWNTTWFLPGPDGEKNRIEGDSVTFLALSPTGPAAVLRPGQRASFTITVRAPFVSGAMQFGLHAFGDPGESGLHDAIDWARLGADLRPADLPDDAWNPLLARVEAQIGTTWGDYLDMLRDNANHLAEIGQRVYDTRELFAFEFVQAAAMGGATHLEAARDAFAPASGLPLSFDRFFTPAPLRRARLGPLGRGWVHSYHIALDERSDGSIVIDGPPVGSDRVFLPDRSGGYRGQSGDNGTLNVLADGRYLLTEQDGLEVVFRADGRWDSMEDTNGNRVTASYDAHGRLITVTHSNGDRFRLEYDASGRLAELIDHADRETHYVYDSSGKYLLSVTRPDGESTTYTYLTGVGALLDHHLTSITRPGGLQVQFTYDELGRLAGQHVAGGEEAFSYAYSTAGKTTAFDAFGNATTTWLDSRGRTAMIEDPLRERMHFTYDVEGNLAGVTGPTGLTAEFLYDHAGNLLTSRDPMGHPTDFGYGGPYDKLLSVYDARGNAVQYAHDDQGNVTRMTYEDGSHEDFQYDGDGNLSAWTNRRGETITYTHNARGQVTAKNVPDTLGADEFAYTYDTVGRLTSATGPEGATVFTYDLGTQRLVRIDYPAVGTKDVFLAFEYDAAGRRTKSTDQDGYVLNYFYDGAGRLVQMTDGADELVVAYEYDAAGRLVGKTLGNGVYTVYTYDAVWQLMSVLNYQADNTVLSRFEYTYDGAGRRIAMDTHYGRWTYRYDDAGQLVRAALVSTDANVPDEDLTYVYDAVGNRIRTVSHGETTEYTTNNMNQYVQVGDRTYLFDADGNLIEETGLDGATTYTYDHENRLIAIARGDDAWQYAYDALGNRFAVEENDAVTRYIVDPIGFGDIVGEYDAVGTVLARYQHGYGLLARIPESGAAAYYTFDAIGSTSELTGPDGTVANVSTYAPFGATIHRAATVANPFGFVGEWGVMEDASGLHHMRNRAYAPQIGRFTSADPIGLVGGDVNLLRYVGNSPIMATDPLGLFEWDSVPNAYKLGSDILSATEGGIRGVLRWGEAGKQYLVGQGLVTSTAFKRLCKINSALSVGGAALSGWDIGTSIHAGDYANATRETALLLGSLVSTNPKFFWVGWALRAWDAGTQELFDWWFSDTDDVRPPRGPQRASGRTPLVPSWTPEDKFGPAGYDGPGVEPGSEERFVLPGQVMEYRIDFWNHENAEVPTQDAVIFDWLDPAVFDVSTFEFTRVGFLDWDVPLPGGQVIDTRIDARPELNIAVEVRAGWEMNVQRPDAQMVLDDPTGKLVWWFHTIDPETGEAPDDPMAGFLPPFNPETGYELGWIEFRVTARDDLPTGVRIENQAFVQFDFMPNPKTGVEWGPAPPDGPWGNTVDAGPPTSWVEPLLVVVNTPEFLVTWDGEDDEDGSGIARWDVYVSTDAGPFTRWQNNATDTSALFTGEFGRAYAYYSIATDNVGHRQVVPATADTVTYVNIPPVITSLTGTPDPVSRGGDLTLTAQASDADGDIVRVEFYRGGISPENLLGTVLPNGDWSLTGVSTAGWTLGEHVLLARAQDDDGAWSEVVTTTVTVYEVTVGPWYDYGDAPDSYGTLLASNGARHRYGSGLFLGQLVDVEEDGQPSDDALGDDSHGDADEDGVVFASILRQGRMATVQVTASEAGYLDAFVDFNADGSFADDGEKIFDRVPVTAGVHQLEFLIPENAASAETFARFRISSAGGLSFDGPAADGEVEDYRITIGLWAVCVPVDLGRYQCDAYNATPGGMVTFAHSLQLGSWPLPELGATLDIADPTYFGHGFAAGSNGRATAFFSVSSEQSGKTWYIQAFEQVPSPQVAPVVSLQVPFERRFDFGTRSSVVETGFLRVSNRTSYSAALGYGWTSGRVRSADRRTGTALERDLILTSKASFAVDVPDGTYQVSIGLGDRGRTMHDLMGVSLQGMAVDPVTTAARELVWHTYTVLVTDRQLNLDFTDLGGKDKNVAIAGVTIVGVPPDTTNPTVAIGDTARAAAVMTDSPMTVPVRFSEPVTGFTASDVQLNWSGPGTVWATVHGHGTGYQVLIHGMEGNGSLTVAIPAGAAMDFSGNPSLASEDAGFEYQYEKRFDFGAARSPVEDGYQQVTNKTTYTSALGYGWQSGKISSANRRTGNALERDLNLTANGVFAVQVPDGIYNVTIRLGDLGRTARDQMGIYLEDTPVDIVSTAAKTILTETYRTVVTDGQLTVGLVDMGGKDKSVAIAGLTISFVTATVGPSAAAEGESASFMAEPRQKMAFSADGSGGLSVTDLDSLLFVDSPNEPTFGSVVPLLASVPPIDLDVHGAREVTPLDAFRGCEKMGTGTFATADFPRLLPARLGASPIFSQPLRVTNDVKYTDRTVRDGYFGASEAASEFDDLLCDLAADVSRVWID